ncbi:MAG: GNAT family protein [Acidobacteriota bacterium]
MIVGQKVRLRAIEREDIPAFVKWFNDPEVRQFLKMFEPMSKAKEERWFETQLESRDQFIFAIEAAADGRWVHIGNTGLMQIDWKNRTAVFGIVLGEKNLWGRGYGTEATRLTLQYAFHQLNLHRVELDVFDYNPRAVRCYERVGFKHEGVRRQAFFNAGRYHDVLRMGILHDELRDEAGGAG